MKTDGIFSIITGLVIGKLISIIVLRLLTENNLTIIDLLKMPILYVFLIPIVSFFIVKASIKNVLGNDY